MNTTQMELAIHHVLLQLLIVKEYRLIYATMRDLKELKVNRLGINTVVLLLKALCDRISGRYKTLVDRHEFDTVGAINSMVKLLHILNK